MQAELFLSDVLANWKDYVKALETCEGMLPAAGDLLVVARCIAMLASKACASAAAWFTRCAAPHKNANLDRTCCGAASARATCRAARPRPWTGGTAVN